MTACEHKGTGHETYAAAAAALARLRANPKIPRLRVGRCPACGRYLVTSPAKAVERTAQWQRRQGPPRGSTSRG